MSTTRKSRVLRGAALGALALLLAASPGAAAWTVQSIGPLPYYATDTALGDGNRDGTRELYVSDWQGFSRFESTSGNWVRARVQVGEDLAAFALAVGDGDRDGEGEVYLGGDANYAPQVRQYVWNATANGWEETVVMTWPSGGQVSTITLGDLEDDGLRELYVGLSVNNTHTVHKVWFKDGGWHRERIATVNGFALGTWIGDGDRDGKPELYVGASNGKVFEVSRGSSGWANRPIGTLVAAAEAVAVGDANHDGQQEVYAVGSNKLYRLTWNGTAYVKAALTTFGTTPLTDLTLGDSSGDGKDEVHLSSSNGHAYTFRWSGSAWSKTDLGDVADGSLATLVLGDGDRDGDRELYAGSDDPEASGPPSGEVFALVP